MAEVQNRLRAEEVEIQIGVVAIRQPWMRLERKENESNRWGRWERAIKKLNLRSESS